MTSPNGLILGIDAGNIRGGGGLTHLSEILSAAEPAEAGLSRIIVWAGCNTLNHLPERAWLELEPVRALQGSLVKRVRWQRHQLDKQLAKNRCDALLIPGGSYWGRFRPFIALCQNMLPFCPRERARFGVSWRRCRYCLLEWIQSRTFQTASGVIFLSDSARQMVLKRIGGCPVQSLVIPHGVHDRFRNRPRPQRPLSAYSGDKPFRWLYVSIINWYKHQEIVARAIAQLRQGGWPAAVDFVGPAHPSALRTFERVLKQLDPNHRFLHYHGAASTFELVTWYRGADGFIFASTCENMPNILLEAMAAGLPVACSRVPPMPEILHDAGGYFDPENQDELANVLLRFMQDPERRAICARRAFERSRAFSWHKCARETFTYVERICASQTRPVPLYASDPSRSQKWRNVPG
jgi:glycosyltransferase involved in cell wall biosynthesis